MAKKKVQFEDLKVGAKFKFNRKLYIKDDLYGSVQLSNGKVDSTADGIFGRTLVTPVKIEIRVKG